ncbi:MAG: periplasmic heavy metal sensor [Pseudomonadota bacterium]
MSESPEPTGPPAKSGRWLKVALFLSLALNLMVIGLVVGAVSNRIGKAGQMPGPGIAQDLALGPYYTALPRETQRMLRRAAGVEARAKEAGLAALRADLRKSLGAVLAELRSADFDAEAFRALIASQSSRLAERRAISQDVLAGLVAEMSADERAAYADRLESALRRPQRSQ